MTRPKSGPLLGALLLLADGTCIAMASPARDRLDGSAASFVTLGTNSGPIPNSARGEPANLLRYHNVSILIDAGDGAAQALGKAGVNLRDVRYVLISHLHFDHTGGLFAFLSQRYQMIAPDPVIIYGPPGTARTVAGLVAAMQPMTQDGTNLRTRSPIASADSVKVIEIGDGAKFQVGEIAIRAAQNSHYAMSSDGGENASTASLSFRFDMPGRSIVYTGDTGPSPAVERLALGADLLVSEIMDPDEAIVRMRATQPGVGAPALASIERHFRVQHLSPDEAGLLAERAKVGALVLTHNSIPPELIDQAGKRIAAHYRGPITFAQDQDRF